MKALFRILTVYQNNMETLLNMQIPRLRQDHVQNGEKSQGIYFFFKESIEMTPTQFQKDTQG